MTDYPLHLRHMNLELFQRRVARRKKGLQSFLKKLDELVPEDMPELVQETDMAVWTDMQCTSCANCCKTMTPTYKKSDIVRIASHLGLSPGAFKATWLKREEESGDWVNKSAPCPFLKNDRCSIYEVRPKDCAEFPHHNKKPFDAYNETFSNNLDKCPATFELVLRLKQRVERDYEWNT